jgi:LPXTG-site transpeptidase (sortase) family protein
MNFGMLYRRLLFALGVVLFVAGAITLSIGLIGYVDENEGQSAANVVPDTPSLGEVRYMPAVPYDPAPAAVEPTPTPAPPPLAIPLRLVVDSIGVDAPVIKMGLDEDGIPHVPLNGQDVAWYDFSSKPGGGSNAVLAAHINWERAAGAFAHLDDAKPGDAIRLISEDGREYTYEVTATFYVDPEDPDSLEVMAPTPTETVTLITCGGTWLPNPSEPFGGSYTTRTIVQGKLVDSTVAQASAVGTS